MRMIGVGADGTVLLDQPLGHGEHPLEVAHRARVRFVRPLDAVRDPTGELVVRWTARPAGDGPAPDVPGRGVDAGLDLTDVLPVAKQRIAAYALVTSDRGLLATEFSDRTAAPGRWGLPGGGIEDHEDPAEAVLRETAEETDQQIALGELAFVQSSHWIGRSPGGVVQDFHAVRLVYLGHCDRPTTPRVLDVDGTTASARWIGVDRWTQLGWTAGWRALLREFLAG